MATATTTATKTPTKKRSQRRSVPAVTDEQYRSTVVDELAPELPRAIAVPLDLIDPHPNNPRQDLGDLEELAASIAEQGLIQPITLVPIAGSGKSPTRYRPIAGHRRTAAARLAGLEKIPALIREGMSEADQLEVMLVENLHRSDLTAFEEGHGMQGLLDLGKSKADLHRRTGRARTTIDHRLQLASLDHRVEKSVLAHQLTLEQAYELAEIQAASRDVYDDLVQDLEKGQLASWRIGEAKARIDNAAKAAKLRADLKADGVKVTKSPPSYFVDASTQVVALKDLGIKSAQHTGCAGHRAYLVESYAGALTCTLVCVAARKHHPAEHKAAVAAKGGKPLTAEEKAKRERDAKLDQDLRDAKDRRWSWIEAMLATTDKANAGARAALVELAAALVRGHSTRSSARFDNDVAWPTDPALVLALACLAEFVLTVPFDAWRYRDTLGQYEAPRRAASVALLDGLEAAGYELAPVEVSMREAFSTKGAVDEGAKAGDPA